MDEKTQIVQAIILMGSFFCSFGLLMIIDISDNYEFRNIKIKVKKMVKFLAMGWIVNLVLFTLTLWIGAYFIELGSTWIEGPISITLCTLGLSKLALSVAIVLGLARD